MTPPTNEAKMPDEVKILISPDRELLFSIDGTTYHHDDKVQELKEALKNCFNLLFKSMHQLDCEATRSHSKPCTCGLDEALTKASNLLK